MKNVILLGKGSLAIKIANWFRENPEYKLNWVVPVIPEPEWTDSLVKWCNKFNVPYIQSGNYQEIPELNEFNLKIDLALSVFYHKIIKLNFIERCSQILNLHPSPLPRYRGRNPVNWALKNKERIHGVTIHQIDKGIDSGPIISQVCFSIDPEKDEVIDVYRRCLEYGWFLFLQTIPHLDYIRPTPQEDELATYHCSKDFDQLGERRFFIRTEIKNFKED
ncbi:MAG: hypothetical protein APR63_09435 [Desulfuromonas sp. SDB]|nr:MAG: hypothetical protein APR63_09435 [Desulfuromonas sp. SDB]